MVIKSSLASKGHGFDVRNNGLSGGTPLDLYASSGAVEPR